MTDENPNEPKAAEPKPGSFEGAKTHAKQAAEELRAAAEAKARELRDVAETKARELRQAATAKADEFRGRAQEYYGEARDRAKTWQEESEGYVRQNPLKAVCGALFAGLVIGLLIRKE
jgi:ElaB/YqjD/DUF883 family membrane-anchored ribosome-binding protein